MDQILLISYIIIFLYTTHKLYFLEPFTRDFIFGIFLEIDIMSSVFSLQTFTLNQKKFFDRIYFVKLFLAKICQSFLFKAILTGNFNFFKFFQSNANFFLLFFIVLIYDVSNSKLVQIIKILACVNYCKRTFLSIEKLYQINITSLLIYFNEVSYAKQNKKLFNKIFFMVIFYFDMILHHIFFGMLYFLTILSKNYIILEKQEELIFLTISTFHAVDFFLGMKIYRPHLMKQYGKGNEEEIRDQLRREKKELRKQKRQSKRKRNQVIKQIKILDINHQKDCGNIKQMKNKSSARKKKKIQKENNTSNNRKRLNKKNNVKQELSDNNQPELKSPQQKHQIQENKIDLSSQESFIDEDELMLKLQQQVQEEQKIPKKQKKQKSEVVIDKKKPFINNKKFPCQGLKYVLTGEFHCVSNREDIKKLIEDLGGKVTTGVSGVTNVLLHGYKLEDGREPHESRKYKNALQKNTLILGENDFSDELEKITGKNLDQQLGMQTNQEYEQNKEYRESFIPKDQHVDIGEIGIDDMLEIQKDEQELWTETYKPKQVNQILGNKELIQKLKNWLKNWNLQSKNDKSRQKENSKAVLLSGSPGIGKTTSAKLIAQELDYDIILMNASDERNKNLVEKFMNSYCQNEVLTTFFIEQKNHLKNKSLIIMDEVDGMMSGDRGGIQELVKQIKKSSRPIICICNNREKQSIKTLAQYCYDLRFKNPNPNEIKQILDVIISKEISNDFWVQLDKSIVRDIIQLCQNDIRQTINYMQMWTQEILNSKKVEKSSIRDQLINMTPFEATRKLMNINYKTMDLKLMKDLFFVDYNLMDSFVFENYLNKPAKDQKIIDLADQCLESMKQGDMCNNLMRRDQNYNILPDFVFLSGIKPSLLIQRYIDFPQFPQNLGKISSLNKKNRLLNELQFCILSQCQVMNENGIFQSIETLNLIIQNLMEQGKFDELYDIYRQFDLTPEIIKEHFEILLSFHSQSKSLEKVSRTSVNKFNKFFASKTEKYTKKNTKKSKKQNSKKEIVQKEETEDDFVVSDHDSMISQFSD